MKRSYEMNLCSGPLLSKILLFSLPLILSGVLQLLFNATDIVVVGKFAGSNAMAAVGSTTSLFNLLVNSFIGISVGANVLVARHYGERDYDGVQQTIQTALLTGLIGGAVPTTPMPSRHTNSRSPKTFITPAAIRKYSGRRVSPTARSTAAPKL